jgi:hypothetical protein
MGLETGDYITDLVPSNPLGTDPKSEGDDHIRLTKKTVQQSWPNINAPVTLTPEQLNDVLIKAEGGTLPDNVHLYFGTANPLDISHDVNNALITNALGELRLRSSVNSGVIALATPDSTDALKNAIKMGGIIPSVKQYYNGILATETITGGMQFNAELDVTHSGSQATIINNSGSLGITNADNGQTLRLRTTDGAGTLGINLDLSYGSVQFFANNIIEAEAISGAFNVINKLKIGGQDQPTDFTRTGDRLDITGVRVV